ncbi:MAG: glycosyltransferase [Burkholderiales bacterium]
MPPREITLSVVSHRQNALVNQLLDDIRRHCAASVALLLTENVPDPLPLDPARAGAPSEIIRNARPEGFSANHNAAFARCNTPYFCVANPDIRLYADPFPILVQTLEGERAGVVGPLVRSPAGAIEASARRFPTPGILLRKLIGARPGPDYSTGSGSVAVDWIAGMFMLFRRQSYAKLGGFDERFFLYYEDVELCGRLRLDGLRVLLEPAACVVHDARRESHRSPRYAWWHLRSISRWLGSETYRRLAVAGNL